MAALWQRANYSLWPSAVNASQVWNGRLDKVKMKMSAVLWMEVLVQLLCNVSLGSPSHQFRLVLELGGNWEETSVVVLVDLGFVLFYA